MINHMNWPVTSASDLVSEGNQLGGSGGKHLHTEETDSSSILEIIFSASSEQRHVRMHKSFSSSRVSLKDGLLLTEITAYTYTGCILTQVGVCWQGE